MKEQSIKFFGNRLIVLEELELDTDLMILIKESLDKS